MNYFTAILSYTAKRLEEIYQANIIVGIPCYTNKKSITHVIQHFGFLWKEISCKEYFVQVWDSKTSKKAET